MQRRVTTTYLEMTDRTQLRPAQSVAVAYQLLRAAIPCPELNRFLMRLDRAAALTSPGRGC